MERVAVSEAGAAQPREQTDLAERIRALGPWFHNMKLGGVQTAPEHFLGDYPAVKFERFRVAVPEDLTGRTVLDIGCNAGFYSMEMKRRGAERVLGIDTDDLYLRQARFAAEVNGLDVEYRKLAVWDVASLGEKFDFVIFMGVLYHLRYPLLALDLIREHVCSDLLLFQSMQRGDAEVGEFARDYPFSEAGVFEDPRWPKMHFIEDRYCNDPTNWWVPNRAGMEAMLRSAGFGQFEFAHDEVYLCRMTEVPVLEGLPEFVLRGRLTP